MAKLKEYVMGVEEPKKAEAEAEAPPPEPTPPTPPPQPQEDHVVVKKKDLENEEGEKDGLQKDVTEEKTVIPPVLLEKAAPAIVQSKLFSLSPSFCCSVFLMNFSASDIYIYCFF